MAHVSSVPTLFLNASFDMKEDRGELSAEDDPYAAPLDQKVVP
ncbi:hypothetical protein [Streptomyces sp. ISL-44]|nr:hypothetical protein [Streptomyces sp. ISL-44]